MDRGKKKASVSTRALQVLQSAVIKPKRPLLRLPPDRNIKFSWALRSSAAVLHPSSPSCKYLWKGDCCRSRGAERFKAGTAKLSFKKRSLWRRKLKVETLLASAGLGCGEAALILLCCTARRFPGCLWWRAGRKRISWLTLAESQRNENTP